MTMLGFLKEKEEKEDKEKKSLTIPQREINTVADLKIDDEYIFAKGDTTVRDVAKKLLRGYYGTALIVDDNNNVLGAITLDIIVAKCIVESRNADETLARDIMDTNIIKVKKHTTIVDLDKMIREKKPAAVVVYDDQDEKVLGYVSPLDMMEALQALHQVQQTGETGENPDTENEKEDSSRD